MNTPLNPAALQALLTVDPATDHIRGPATARVTLIEYGDFECPNCRQAYSAVKILLDHFGADLRLVFRHFPLREVHPHAELAAEATEAAAAQHKFWPLHDLLFAHQQQLDATHVQRYAEQAGLDMLRYAGEMNDHIYLQRVQEQMEGARSLRVRSTPTFYVNGEQADVSFGFEFLQQEIERALKAAPG